MFGNVLAAVFGGGLTSIIGAGNEVVKTLKGDKAAEQAAIHQEIMGVQAAYIAETAKPNTNWFDSFTDGMNRLVRPFCTYGVIALFVWAYKDPAEFQVAMLALQAVPEWLQLLAASILGFWFVVRGTSDVLRTRAEPMVQKAVASTAANVASSIAEKVEEVDPSSPVNNPTLAKLAGRKNPTWDARKRRWVKGD